MLHAPYEPISGMAPFTYALSGAHICIPGEKPAEFESLLADITAEMKPAGPATQFLVEEMAQCQWKLRRSTVILRDHYRFLLNITDYKTVGNAFLRDNIGVHSITKLARYDNLLRRAWRECYTLLQNRTRPRANQRDDDAGEPRVQQAGSSNPPSPSATPARHNPTECDTADAFPTSHTPLATSQARQNSTDFDTESPFSELRSPTSDLPSSNSTDCDTLPPSSDLRSPKWREPLGRSAGLQPGVVTQCPPSDSSVATPETADHPTSTRQNPTETDTSAESATPTPSDSHLDSSRTDTHAKDSLDLVS